MAGAGARTRKDGSASAKVGSIEVLRSRQIGPAVPMRRQVQAMATGAASAERAARTPAARAAAASLREKAESAGQARAAFLAARKGEKGAAQEAGARAMRAGAAAQFAKAPPKAAEPVTPRAPLKRWEPQSRRAVRDRNDRVMTKVWNAQKAHRDADPTHQTLQAQSDKASAHARKNFRDYKVEVAAKAKAEAAADKLYAHEDKLRAEWASAHPKEARLAVLAGAGERRAMLNEKRQGDASMQRYRRKQAEIDKAEAPAREKAAAEAHARFQAQSKAFAEQERAKDAREKAQRVEAKARYERENNARNAAAEKEQRAYVSKAREVIASHPTPKGHVAIYTKDNHAKGEAPKVVKALHQAGDVAAHRPINSNGKGYSITHKPTGLSLGHVDSAAAAKHVVNGFASPHMGSMLSKIANGEDKDGKLGNIAGPHFKKLRDEGATMAAAPRATPTPKLAFGKMTSDNKFKAARAA